jgi:hypothetical protein
LSYAEDSFQVGRWYIVPVKLPFPVWHYVPQHWDADDRPDAFGWWPDSYSWRSFDTLEEAEAFRTSFGGLRT